MVCFVSITRKPRPKVHPALENAETRDCDHYLMFRMFTEVIHPRRSKVVYLNQRKNASLRPLKWLLSCAWDPSCLLSVQSEQALYKPTSLFISSIEGLKAADVGVPSGAVEAESAGRELEFEALCRPSRLRHRPRGVPGVRVTRSQPQTGTLAGRTLRRHAALRSAMIFLTSGRLRHPPVGAPSSNNWTR